MNAHKKYWVMAAGPMRPMGASLATVCHMASITSGMVVDRIQTNISAR